MTGIVTENEAALKPLLLETGGTTKVAERATDRYVSTNLVTGHGVSLTTTYFAVLGMPLVKTVTRAGPKGKSFTGREVKLVSDQPPTGSTGRKDNLAVIDAAQLHDRVIAR